MSTPSRKCQEKGEVCAHLRNREGVVTQLEKAARKKKFLDLLLSGGDLAGPFPNSTAYSCWHKKARADLMVVHCEMVKGSWKEREEKTLRRLLNSFLHLSGMVVMMPLPFPFDYNETWRRNYKHLPQISTQVAYPQ